MIANPFGSAQAIPGEETARREPGTPDPGRVPKSFLCFEDFLRKQMVMGACLSYLTGLWRLKINNTKKPQSTVVPLECFLLCSNKMAPESPKRKRNTSEP